MSTDPEIINIGIGTTIYSWEFENSFLLDKDYFLSPTETNIPLFKIRPASKIMQIDGSRMESHGILRYINYKDPVPYTDPLTNEIEYITVWGIMSTPALYGHQNWSGGAIYAPYVPLTLIQFPAIGGFIKRFGIKGNTP